MLYIEVSEWVTCQAAVIETSAATQHAEAVFPNECVFTTDGNEHMTVLLTQE